MEKQPSHYITDKVLTVLIVVCGALVLATRDCPPRSVKQENSNYVEVAPIPQPSPQLATEPERFEQANVNRRRRVVNRNKNKPRLPESAVGGGYLPKD